MEEGGEGQGRAPLRRRRTNAEEGESSARNVDRETIRSVQEKVLMKQENPKLLMEGAVQAGWSLWPHRQTLLGN